MESDGKVEMIKKAINKLMMELEDNDEIKSLAADDGDNATSRRQLLNKLLSEIEWLEQDKGEPSEEEIIKEVKKVQRQNSITHYLLTAMIVLTVAWQLSEVSLILKIKHGLSNPFKSVGEMAKGFLKGKGGRRGNSVEDVMKAASDAHKQIVQPALKLPNFDLSGFDTTDEEDETRKYLQN